ncbi:hypothetical protein FGO68_gene1016 [Halteria grandinella]|uniref:Uncharacterized protein n=1 Tax=Halteria grandinella TaxID=5974 RepID=A0A8J8P2P2_HALGN|nr:hypothetical protein FGO68_gene1016 [Halteria grandinella]
MSLSCGSFKVQNGVDPFGQGNTYQSNFDLSMSGTELPDVQQTLDSTPLESDGSWICSSLKCLVVYSNTNFPTTSSNYIN